LNSEDRRESKRAVRDAERLTFVERMPFSPAIAKRMFEALDEDLGLETCRHDFELTARWCERQSINPARAIAWLRSEGAGCDCEVFDVEDRFTDAMKAFR
jgi:hypothetical protein